MTRYLIETCWIQKKRYSGITEYYDLIKEVCHGIDGVELLGLFQPLSEGWNWAYIIETDDLEKWEDVKDEVSRRYFDKRENITQSITRIYTALAYNPRPKNLGNLKYLWVELDLWEGINVGIKEYFDAHVQVFEGKEGVWFMGQYVPWNDEYNWVHFYWFKSVTHMIDMSIDSHRATGRPDRITLILTRLYERYDPVE